MMLADEMSAATYKAALDRFSRDAEQSGDKNALYRAHLLRTFDDLLEIIGKLNDRVDALERRVEDFQRHL